MYRSVGRSLKAVTFNCCSLYNGCVERWSTRVLRVKVVKSSVVVVTEIIASHAAVQDDVA